MRTNTTALTAVAMLVGSANAGTLTLFDNRTDFDNATGAQTIETFENETLGGIAMPAAFASGLGADLVSGSVSSFIEAGDPDAYGFFNTTAGGRKYLRFGDNIPGGPPETGSYSVEFTFGQTVRAFGFDLSGFQPDVGAGGFNVSLFSNGQLVQDFFLPSDQPFPGVEFYGFALDSGFDAARVNLPVLNGGASSADYVAFDDVTWSTVPTPGPFALAACGSLLTARRRRRA